MKLRKWVRKNPRLEKRMQVITELGRRRARILERPELDLNALTLLVANYEAANLPCTAAELRRRLEHYRAR